MSHFTVIVFGEDVEEQLAPYHEFECTGVNDEYVQTLDVTAETREEFENDTVNRLKDAEGNLHEPWDDRFFREPTEEEAKEFGSFAGGFGTRAGFSYSSKDWNDGKGYRPKVRFIPEGFEEIDLPRSEVESFAEFLKDYHGFKPVPFGEEPDIEGDHKYGYYLQDAEGNVITVFDRTNAPWTEHVWCLGCSPTNHAQGNHDEKVDLRALRVTLLSDEDQPTREEVLSALREDEGPRELPPSVEKSRRSLHLLLRLHERAQLRENTGTPASLAPKAEIRVDAGDGGRTSPTTGSVVRDLQEGSEGAKVEVACGSLPQDGQDSRSPLWEVQHDVGSRGGQLRLAWCGSEISHPPHELTRNTLGGSKWDWWTVGGRWRGFFRLKAGAARHPELIGSPGVFDNEPHYDADVAPLGDIDIEGMRDLRGRQAAQEWNRAHAVFGDTPEVPAWLDFLSQMEEQGKTIDEAREAYRVLPRMVAVEEHDKACRETKAYDDELLGFGGDITEYQVPFEQYVQRARDRALKPYAYVHEGQWVAPGSMGWWAISNDEEEDRIAYTEKFNELLDSLPDDTVLTLVDCHI